MKQRLILAFFLIIFFSCKKEETSNQQNSTEYYFEATLSDGRTFKIKDTDQTSASKFVLQAKLVRIDMGATETVMDGMVSDQNAHPVGHDFFGWTFILLNAEKEGAYNPNVMVLIAKEGAEHYSYTSRIGDATLPAMGNVNLTISKIEAGTGTGYGVLQGTFSGTVIRERETVPNVETPIQISGKFRLALYINK
jgi:hypothetical protein